MREKTKKDIWKQDRSKFARHVTSKKRKEGNATSHTWSGEKSSKKATHPRLGTARKHGGEIVST